MTLKEAVEKSIELWEWLAETGKDKDEWFEMKGIYEDDRPDVGCYLCEVADEFCAVGDMQCPLKFCTFHDTPFNRWWASTTKTKPTRRKYAQQVVDQLKAWQEKHETKTTLK